MYVFRLLFVIRIFEFSVLTVALIVDPGNFRLDYEELAVTNFSYSVRVFQRLLGCQACNAEAMANLTVYVKDCSKSFLFAPLHFI